MVKRCVIGQEKRDCVKQSRGVPRRNFLTPRRTSHIDRTLTRCLDRYTIRSTGFPVTRMTAVRKNCGHGIIFLTSSHFLPPTDKLLHDHQPTTNKDGFSRRVATHHHSMLVLRHGKPHPPKRTPYLARFCLSHSPLLEYLSHVSQSVLLGVASAIPRPRKRHVV